MLHLVLDFTVRATLIAAATALVLWMMRIKNAATQHTAWTGVLVAMLALPAWEAWGPKTPIRVLPAGTQARPQKPYVADRQRRAADARTGNEGRSTSMHLQFQTSDWQILFAFVYLTGLSILLVRLGFGTVGANLLVRRAVHHGGRLTNSACAAPIAVGWFRPTVILPADWLKWSPEKVGAVLIHENEHARRRDPLVHWAALLGRALFWFHPLTWWLERQLSYLAERACDTRVLARGYDPHNYAEYLLEISHSVRQARSRLSIAGLMMPGSLLQRRLRQIICARVEPRVSRFRMLCTALACTTASALLAAGRLERTRPTVPPHPFEIQRQLNPAKNAFSQANATPATTPKRPIADLSSSAAASNPALTRAAREMPNESPSDYKKGVSAELVSRQNHTVSSNATIPNTRAGYVLKAWLEAFNSGDRALSQAFIQKFASKESVDLFLQFSAATGRIELLSIDKSERTHIEFQVSQVEVSKTAVGELEVTKVDPLQIVSMNFRGLQVLPPRK